MLKKVKIGLLLSLWIFGLTGCGFHLRDASLIPAPMKILYLETKDPYAEFTLTLQKELQAFGVHLVDQKMQAPYTLHLVQQSFSQQLTSISETTLIRTYTLTATVSFEIVNRQGKVVLPPQTISASSTYVTNDNQLLATNQATQEEQQQLNRDLIFRLLAHLHSHQASKALQ